MNLSLFQGYSTSLAATVSEHLAVSILNRRQSALRVATMGGSSCIG
jgi:hypothetical protein